MSNKQEKELVRFSPNELRVAELTVVCQRSVIQISKETGLGKSRVNSILSGLRRRFKAKTNMELRDKFPWPCDKKE